MLWAWEICGCCVEWVFLVVGRTMGLIGIRVAHFVGSRGWTVVVGGAVVCGAAGLAMMGAALSPRFGPRNAAALALAGSVLLERKLSQYRYRLGCTLLTIVVDRLRYDGVRDGAVQPSRVDRAPAGLHTRHAALT